MSAVIVALAGAFVGGLIAELRSWLQGRRDTQRVLRRVLHRQLEIRHAVLRANQTAFLDAFGNVLARRFGVDPAQARTELRNNAEFRGAFTDLVCQRLDVESAAKYELTIEALAEVDPLLAFQLSGKGALSEFRERVTTFATRLNPTPSAKDAQDLLKLQPLMDDALYKSTVDVLEADIEIVARALGWRTRRRARQVLTSVAGVESELERELNAWLDKAEMVVGIPIRAS